MCINVFSHNDLIPRWLSWFNDETHKYAAFLDDVSIKRRFLLITFLTSIIFKFAQLTPGQK